MHPYRTCTCGALRADHVGQTARLSGWIYRKRDHGQLLFIDLRDTYGVTQVVLQPGNENFDVCRRLKLESVITVTGDVAARAPETVNPDLATGQVELHVRDLGVESDVGELPLYLAGDDDGPEDTRLRYRFLDLRRERMQRNILLRSRVIADLRERMQRHGFHEFQTPILTSSSPEGARDYLVPSRVHPGRFYALPQAPQQFKQLLMVAGFDRYFQIAPCFRDEDARADRSPGEFYQLDIEMAFATQDDVFAVVEDALYGTFKTFSDATIDATPFPRIPYREAMIRYGTDKPDLRIPIEMQDVTDVFKDAGFKAFSNAIERGETVRAIPVADVADRPRSFYDRLVTYAQDQGARGLAYLVIGETDWKGPIAKFLTDAMRADLQRRTGIKTGGAIFFICDQPQTTHRLAGDLRTKLGRDLERIPGDVFRFCWVVDYPMYEEDPETGDIGFSHNPFSMPQGGMQALRDRNPLDVLAWQYDIVCNGYELSSGAIRNHSADIMYRAFEIAGYTKHDVDARFGAMIRAFKTGAPPHGGIAPGIDRIVMLLAGETNIREVIAFPLNQRAQDLMMDAPAPVSDRQLRELHLKLALPRRGEGE